MMFGNEVAEVLAVMRKEKTLPEDVVSQEAIRTAIKMVESTSGLWEGLKARIAALIQDEVSYEYPKRTVWWCSVIMQMSKDPVIFQKFVEFIIMNRERFPISTQYFLFYQLCSLMFRFRELNLWELKEKMWMFYMEIVEEFSKSIKVSLDAIPMEKRNNDFVVVITEQFLMEQHGPTKTALDRCKALITRMNKKVLLINTGEVLTEMGSIPFFNLLCGNYIQERLNENEQYWKGVKVPYYQCEHNMPNVETMNQLLGKIREMAPGYIVTIGRGGILGNLASRMLTTLTVGLGPADFEYTCAKYQTLSRKLEERDIALLHNLGFSEKHVIESIFTSSLKPQTEHINRNILGISEEVFLIVVVGVRLYDEVTDEFLEMLEGIGREDIFVGFIGEFRNYEKCIEKFPILKNQSANLGFCDDILSRLELCDLYVNPIRSGGGTSCVEAMFKGVPVVTVNYGDVSVNVGEEFCVKDYREMQSKILEYYEDKEFYEMMSKKAIRRAEILLDTETEFARIMQEMDKREKEC